VTGGDKRLRLVATLKVRRPPGQEMDIEVSCSSTAVCVCVCVFSRDILVCSSSSVQLLESSLLSDCSCCGILSRSRVGFLCQQQLLLAWGISAAATKDATAADVDLLVS
jgi:hypothetical protein